MLEGTLQLCTQFCSIIQINPKEAAENFTKIDDDFEKMLASNPGSIDPAKFAICLQCGNRTMQPEEHYKKKGHYAFMRPKDTKVECKVCGFELDESAEPIDKLLKAILEVVQKGAAQYNQIPT
eukprot:TRINITY_DN135468_c0_g1_i1.p2 TRINITY_DN135468_c0_g1~~TRINITY_DN135468_c0_g1_i1.p2  ORF type:complete len:123 (+),score=10.58 TRINITY_DN135468_c0_g1_i1:132-500(+)